MKPTTAFGEAFQYSNPMVSAGGYIAAHLLHPGKTLGAAYDAAMDALVFRPLRMSATTFDFKRARRGDHATPHAMDWQLAYKPVPIESEGWLPAVRPAGGAWSNLRDMARFVLLHLGKGVSPEGKRIVSEENLARRYEPQVRISKDSSYGLGLVVEESHGVQTIWHTGGTAGFSTEIFFLPEHGFGAVILTNGSDSFLSGALKRKLLELLFDGRDEAKENLDARWKRVQAAVAKEAAKVKVAMDMVWLKRVFGEYENPALGKLSVRQQSSGMVMGAVLDVGEWRSRVGQKREFDGTQKLVLLDPPYTDFEFLPGEKGGKRTLQVETNQQKYLFVETSPSPRK
jgi:CubicO group peptidase (beta-lactamase class C family)